MSPAPEAAENVAGLVLVALVERDSSAAISDRFDRGWRAPLEAGRRLAGARGVPLVILVAGPEGTAAALERARAGLMVGAARLLCAETETSPSSAAPHAAADVAAWLGGVARDEGALHLLLAHDYASLEHLPVVAAESGSVMVSGVVDLELAADGSVLWSRPSHQGRRIERLVSAARVPVVATIRADGFARPAGGASAAPVGEVALERRSFAGGIRESPSLEWLADESVAGALDLAAAERIVSVGRGLGDPDRLGPIRELCRALGAELAGSRPVIDAGWLPRERQVGSSGATVSPSLYLALGISGSSQHLAGMSTSRCIVAVNQDAEAPIFRVAHLGIVGDLHLHAAEIVEALRRDSGDCPQP